MGMYTEVLFRSEVKGLPDEVVRLFEAINNDDDDDHVIEEMASALYRSHEFFQCDRWLATFTCNSAYFETPAGFHFMPADYGPQGYYTLFFHSSLKNYDGEIGKFFNWIQPYLAERGGVFIGYELYEEGDRPTLHFAEVAK